MKILRVFGLLLVVFTVWLSASPAQAVEDLTHMSCLGQLSAGTITRLEGKQVTKQVTSRAFFNTLSSLHGNNIWVGYQKGGWDIQGTKTWESVIVVQPQGYQIWIMRSSAAPQLRYVWGFRSMTSNADPNGNHLGNHDFCAAMSVATWRITYLYRLAGVQ